MQRPEHVEFGHSKYGHGDLPGAGHNQMGDHLTSLGSIMEEMCYVYL